MYSGEKTVEELKREWKKTKKEEIGVMYVNKLIAMNEYELAKKITLELKKYTKNKIDIYTTSKNAYQKGRTLQVFYLLAIYL